MLFNVMRIVLFLIILCAADSMFYALVSCKYEFESSLIGNTYKLVAG